LKNIVEPMFAEAQSKILNTET